MLAVRRHSRKLNWITRPARPALAGPALAIPWLPRTVVVSPACVNAFARVSDTQLVTSLAETLHAWYHAHNHAHRGELEQALGVRQLGRTTRRCRALLRF